MDTKDKVKKEILILSIDTSCDETSASVTRNLNVLSNVISSQIELHKKYGGVVPLVAKRAHEERIEPVITEALKRAKVKIEDLDAIAVTYGPGLAIALEVGVSKAKELAIKYQKPLIGINHMEGHFLSSLAKNSKSVGNNIDLKFPIMGLLMSGKHTEIVLCNEIGKYEIIGETLDDAVGEAYDKVARMLGLGYPGGRVLSDFADKGEDKYHFTIPMINQDNLNFSYSGIKTAVMYFVKTHPNLNKQEIYNVAKSFEESAIKHILDRLSKALKKYPVKLLFVGGGVASNPKIRSAIRKESKKHGVSMYAPRDKKLYMDNAAMIGIAAYYKYLKSEFTNPTTLDRNPKLGL
jgi:N6-L-threonylcarbamoyladenine synthase